ncbi:hypothetical protein V6N11_002476 [Hibiscus sabdariffa]|uniref:Sodium/calcium exchanger membrane region domain-containing protein n=1 Tax=Hibiscus sabdariffa TaxID=183260 RepID=A0ABR2SB84_9ROSI
MGFWSGFSWLVGMTLVIALLSEYVVGTIEAASESWGISISFISIILISIVGNAAEHAGAIIFAFKNKLDMSLGVALGFLFIKFQPLWNLEQTNVKLGLNHHLESQPSLSCGGQGRRFDN